MKELGLRDYADQLRDALELFRTHKNLIPEYDHILVDEYQDVNKVQKDLLDTLAPHHLFVVGDPRQSIFGWRGSKIRYILDFPTNGGETIVLKRNYRSGKEIVSLVNMSIRRLNLPDLEGRDEPASINLHTFRSEADEISFIAEKILASERKREEIFVLTRTNKQIQTIAEHFNARGIRHVTRSDDAVRLVEAREGEVTLSTVHAIKGLEASCVFVAHLNNQSFPCIASDHPVLELVKREEHDREEEELRLLYVAMSRAQEELHLSYSGNASKFLSNDMKKLLGVSHDSSLHAYKPQGNATFEKLRTWRAEVARASGLPAYMIFSDKTLLALAHEQPRDIADLSTVSGVGPVKVQKYGDAILDVLHR